MQIDGEWLLSEDSIVRPVICGEVLAASGIWEPTEFLVDTGADQIVLSACVLRRLGLRSLTAQERIGGLGGIVDSVVVATEIRLTREGGGKVIFRSQYAAVTELEALDMSVLGRDVTGLFALVADQPQNALCLLGQRHYYTIHQY
jgi:predicted aspartyl protease